MEGLTPQEQKIMLDALKRNAQRGNLPSLEFLLKMIGQHPDQESGTDTTVVMKIEGMDEYAD